MQCLNALSLFHSLSFCFICFIFISIRNIQHYVPFVLNIFHHAQIPMFIKKLSSTKGWMRAEWKRTQSNRINENDSLDPKIKACNHYLSVSRVSNVRREFGSEPETRDWLCYYFHVYCNREHILTLTNDRNRESNRAEFKLVGKKKFDERMEWMRRKETGDTDVKKKDTIDRDVYITCHVWY